VNFYRQTDFAECFLGWALGKSPDSRSGYGVTPGDMRIGLQK